MHTGCRITLILLIWIMLGCKENRFMIPEISWTRYVLFGADDGERSIGVAGPVTGTHGDYLIVAGGANFPGKMPWDGGDKVYHDSGAVYALSREDMPRKFLSFRMSMRLAYAASVSTPMGVVFAGGEDADGPSAKVRRLRFDIGTGGVLEESLPDLPYEVTNGSMVAHENVLYFLGGENKMLVYNHLLYMDMAGDAPCWSFLDTLPNAVSNAFAGIIKKDNDIELFVLGGRQKSLQGESRIFRDAYRYSLSERRWRACAPFPTSIAAGTIVDIEKPGILVIGGDIGEMYRKTENLIRRIEEAHDPQIKDILREERRIVQMGHPGFTNKVWLYNPYSDSWNSLGQVPFETPVTATAVFAKGRIYIPSGEIRPGVRSNKVLVGRFNSVNQ